MPELLINIDVENPEQAADFYIRALGLRRGRKLFKGGVIELLGGPAPIYLLQNKAGTKVSPASSQTRDYSRHWIPVHLDFIVADMQTALEQAVAAGARLESGPMDCSYGKLATFADPFGHGFCLIEWSEQGYTEDQTDC